MKIKKVEDLRKCHWRKLTEQEWGKVPIHWEKHIFKEKKCYVNESDIDFFAQNCYRKIARQVGLSVKKVNQFLREENCVFHQKLVDAADYKDIISEEDFFQLKQLLEIPVIISEEGAIRDILEQVNKLSNEEKVIFAGEIWNNYLYPELKRQEVEEMREFFK